MTTDFSGEAKKALPYAAAFAKQLGSEVTLLNVLESSRFVGLESMILLPAGDLLIGRVYQSLDALAKQAFKSKAVVKTHVRTGKPFREIIRAARELDTDLIIMATHGYTGLKHTFLGSTTERVVQHAPCPVLVVRGGETEPFGRRQKQRVVLTTDFSRNSLRAFPLAESLAAEFKAGVTLVNVVERFPIDSILGEELTRGTTTVLMEQARARLRELSASLRKRSGIKADVVVRFGAPFVEITRTAKALAASLIVIATHGYTGLKHIWLGSTTERVVRHSHCPVLVVRELNRKPA